ncbi:MAG TPA: M56 family metallopeptidase, partial [Pirellulaceae bacterium]|nr:M56 family metallopeptidase [Pirellulaceae bacterium]
MLTRNQFAKRLEPILAHELIHFRRGDTIVGTLQLAAQIIWWFHPLVWWASRELTRERERCCDEEAVAGLKCDPGDYAQILLDVLRSKRQLKPLFAQPGVRSIDITARRLEHIMRVDRVRNPRTPKSCWIVAGLVAALVLPGGRLVLELGAAGDQDFREVAEAPGADRDWPQYGGGPQRNNVSREQDLPISWNVEKGENIKWTAQLGDAVYSSPVMANGKVLIGTNNGAAYGNRFPKGTDASCLLCFDAATGDFLWQHANEKLASGRVNDWPGIGICSTSMIEGDRVWYVNNRDEVVCLDLEGFYDSDNDGPFREEPATALGEADVVWKLDLIAKFGVAPHNQSICSITAVEDLLLVGTSHGIDLAHVNQPADAPSFIAVHKTTGRVVWQDASPSGSLLHGQWSSPAYGVIGGVGQAIFAGGDGWLYSFDV